MLTVRVLGPRRGDTSLLVTIDSGQAVHRLLLDCGSGWASRARRRDVLSVEHVFISHFHLDHVIGFDVLLRANIGEARQINVWGPTDTGRFVQHRLQGYVWNLVADSELSFRCHDVTDTEVTSRTFLCCEGFARAHDEARREHDGTVLDEPDYEVRVALLDHGIPVLAVAVAEPVRVNVQPEVLEARGWPPGAWLAKVKDESTPDETTVEVAGEELAIGALRKELLTHTRGGSMAFVTDTILNDQTIARIQRLAAGVNRLYCEASFLEADRHLADRHHHMTAHQVGQLARRLQVGRLVLVHPSDRYPTARVLLKEAAAVFPRTETP